MNKKVQAMVALGFMSFIIIGSMFGQNIQVFSVENEIEAFHTNNCLEAPIITNQERLGTMTHYNGIIFTNFTAAQADVEGALAVGGTSQIGTLGMGFDFGYAVIGQYTNPNHYPTFLTRNQPTFHGGQWGDTHFNVFGGAMVVGAGVATQFCETATLNNNNHLVQGSANVWLNGFNFASEEAVDGFFWQAQNRSITTANQLAGATHTEELNITVNQLNNGSADFTNLSAFIPTNLEITGRSMIVINIIDGGHITINEPKLNGAFSAYDLVVLNFPNATSVDFQPAALMINGAMMGSLNSQMGVYAERLLWNFPSAHTINVSHHDVVGTVLAPLAHYNANGGSTNGMLIANEYTTVGSHELHAFRPGIRDDIFNVRPITPEVNPIDPEINEPDPIDPEETEPTDPEINEPDPVDPEDEEEIEEEELEVDEEDEEIEEDEELEVDEEDEEIEEDEELEVDEEDEEIEEDEELEVDEEDEEIEEDEELEVDEEIEEDEMIEDEDKEETAPEITVPEEKDPEIIIPEKAPESDYIGFTPLPEDVDFDWPLDMEDDEEIVDEELEVNEDDEEIEEEELEVNEDDEEIADEEDEDETFITVVPLPDELESDDDEEETTNETTNTNNSNSNNSNKGNNTNRLPQTGHVGISFSLIGGMTLLSGAVVTVLKKRNA